MWSLGLGTVFWVLPLHRMSSGPRKDAPLNGASLCRGCNEPIVWNEADHLWILARGHQPPGRPLAKCDKTGSGTHERNEVAEDRVRFYGRT